MQTLCSIIGFIIKIAAHYSGVFTKLSAVNKLVARSR